MRHAQVYLPFDRESDCEAVEAEEAELGVEAATDGAAEGAAALFNSDESPAFAFRASCRLFDTHKRQGSSLVSESELLTVARGASVMLHARVRRLTDLLISLHQQ